MPIPNAPGWDPNMQAYKAISYDPSKAQFSEALTNWYGPNQGQQQGGYNPAHPAGNQKYTKQLGWEPQWQQQQPQFHQAPPHLQQQYANSGYLNTSKGMAQPQWQQQQQQNPFQQQLQNNPHYSQGQGVFGQTGMQSGGMGSPFGGMQSQWPMGQYNNMMKPFMGMGGQNGNWI